MALKGLSDADVLILQAWIDAEKRRNPGYRGKRTRERTHAESEDHQAPEVYTAKTPSGGIPALVSGDGGTGTSGYDEPGSATCDVYVIDETDATPDLRSTGKSVIVYNISSTGVPGSVYIPIGRDKFGKWLPMVGGAAPCDYIRFVIDAVYQDTTPYYATVDILSRTCGCSAVEEEVEATGTGTGETIFVYDMAGCFFNEPEVDLIGRVGYAKYLIDEDYEEVAAGTGTGTGTGAGTGDCRWEVVHLCCPADCDIDTGTP